MHTCPLLISTVIITLGKLYQFTNLNLAAIEEGDFPEINHDSRVRENIEVIIV